MQPAGPGHIAAPLIDVMQLEATCISLVLCSQGRPQMVAQHVHPTQLNRPHSLLPISASASRSPLPAGSPAGGRPQVDIQHGDITLSFLRGALSKLRTVQGDVSIEVRCGALAG
jgi:hypothetical protein